MLSSLTRSAMLSLAENSPKRRPGSDQSREDSTRPREGGTRKDLRTDERNLCGAELERASSPKYRIHPIYSIRPFLDVKDQKSLVLKRYRAPQKNPCLRDLMTDLTLQDFGDLTGERLVQVLCDEKKRTFGDQKPHGKKKADNRSPSSSPISSLPNVRRD
jgi:hypothetical protein